MPVLRSHLAHSGKPAFFPKSVTLSPKDAMAIAQKDAGLTLAEAEQEARRLMRLENASRGGRAQGLQMPTNKEGLKAGQVYQTARGLAKWDGQKFTLVD